MVNVSHSAKSGDPAGPETRTGSRFETRSPPRRLSPLARARRRGKLRRAPHPAGKQQLPERRGRLSLRPRQRRAPFSERKCGEAGPAPRPRLVSASRERPEAARGGRDGGVGGGRRAQEAETAADGPPAPPGSLPSGSAPGRSSASRRRALLPGLGGTRRRKETRPAQPPSGHPALTHPWPRWRSALCGD